MNHLLCVPSPAMRSLPRKMVPVLCGGVLCLLLTSCGLFSSREVTVTPVAPSDMTDYYIEGIIGDKGLSFETANFLRGNLMQDDFSENPALTLKRINEYFEISQNPLYYLIAADLCTSLGRQAEPESAIRYYLSAFYYLNAAKRTLTQKTNGTFRLNAETQIAFLRVQLIYNELCCAVFHYLKTHDLLMHDSFSLQDIEGKRYNFRMPTFRLSVPVDAVADFSLCSQYQVNNLRQTNRRAGGGVPLVATLKPKELYRSLRMAPGLTIPVTYLLRMVYDDKGERYIESLFQDTGLLESMNMEKYSAMSGEWPLAVDFSTPLACFLHNLPDRNLISVMLHPDTEEKIAGLYMMEPFQPGKIPVVFVHGLMSGPGTWVQMINSLKNSPEIRKHYQFWFFYYSSGSPVFASAKMLYQALMDAEKELATTPEIKANFERMVLVGHSMGGLLCRTLLQKDPHYLMETVMHCPWEDILAKLSDDEVKFMQSIGSCPALPFVHRVVFCAVPHKGADMAKRPIAAFGSRIIRLPQSILSKKDTLRRIAEKVNAKDSELAVLHGRFFTGIDNLDPDNPFIRALGSSQMKDDLVYHSIIGNEEQDSRPGGSDGVVPYESSHLDGAASELIVKSWHSVHRSPEAIRELLRILLLHLKTVEGK